MRTCLRQPHRVSRPRSVWIVRSSRREAYAVYRYAHPCRFCVVPEISSALYRAGSGEPLVLLHGFTGTWHHWRAVLGDLVARYEVLAPTLAGHDGGPALPISSPLTFASAADSLEGHLDELGVGTAHIAGNSMGG